MSGKIADLLASEAEHYEEHYNDPDSEADSKPGHRRAAGAAPRLLTIRLTQEQYREIAVAAEASDLPVSTFARNVLMAGVAEAEESAVERSLAQALRKVLKPELLRAG